MNASAVSADTRLPRAVSPFSPSTYCTSMPKGSSRLRVGSPVRDCFHGRARHPRAPLPGRMRTDLWKSNSRWSRRNGGDTFDRAANILSVQPGDRCSHSRKNSFTCLSLRLSCDPQRSQGIMGKARRSAYWAREFTPMVARGRITTCRPSFERNFGGIVLSLPV